MILISNREKDIINAADMIVPLASKSFFARHISKNFKIRLRDNISMEYYWRSINTYSNDEYNV